MSMGRKWGASVEVELLSADLPGAMEAMAKWDIPLENGEAGDELHLRFQVSAGQLHRLYCLAARRGDEVTVLSRRGLIFRLQGLAHRKLLVLGLLAILFLSLWVPSRVLFIQVEGNDAVSTGQILEAAAQCGIDFGASRRAVRSEKMKNALLETLPGLQWAGINTYGCRAVITVRERSQSQQAQTEAAVSSIVAARDGIIRELTVLKGNALCQVGQAVQAGQVLVSGYTDCGICIQAGPARAEVYADTQRRLRAVIPTNYSQRTEISAVTKKYSLIIGKKRINFFKGSGISGTTCAKIYEQKYLTLPGGFVLPIAIVCETWYDYGEEAVTLAEGENILSEFAAAYLPSQMVAGVVNQASQVFFHSQDCITLEGIYSCYEMIGVTRPEERMNE